MKMKSFFALILLLCTTLCFTLEINNGRIRLVLHKNLGRFSMYYLSNPEKKKYTSFLLDQDIRTSTLSVAVDNNVFRLGDTGSFKEKIEETSIGARFIWNSKQLEIIEDFVFTKTPSASETNGVIITLTIANISNKELTVGARYVFDTFLGESSNHHFRTDKHDNISNEIIVEKDRMIRYWVSPLPKSDPFVGLQVSTNGGGVTIPDKIIFANWKRLNDTPWTYDESAGRNFNLRPYSINDSAVCHYYYPKTLEAGSRMRIVIAMHNYDESSASVTEEPDEQEVKDILEEVAATPTPAPAGKGETDATPTPVMPVETADESSKPETVNDQIIADIHTLEYLLKMIDDRIKTKEITDKDLSTMEKILFEIKDHITAIMKSY
ncbi:MAG: hypothetical protein JW881_01120 [Spirochaetales bacterium]|nr:hypothetical protein [Spirochaetales bacterium]